MCRLENNSMQFNHWTGIDYERSGGGVAVGNTVSHKLDWYSGGGRCQSNAGSQYLHP